MDARGRSRSQQGLGGRKRTLGLRNTKTMEVGTPANEGRPTNRSECRGGERPCPWMACRYHLAHDITRVGSLIVNFPDRELEQLEETCALDVADRGGATLATVGRLMNLTRERARQIEVRGCVHLAAEIRNRTTEHEETP